MNILVESICLFFFSLKENDIISTVAVCMTENCKCIDSVHLVMYYVLCLYPMCTCMHMHVHMYIHVCLCLCIYGASVNDMCML